MSDRFNQWIKFPAHTHARERRRVEKERAKTNQHQNRLAQRTFRKEEDTEREWVSEWDGGLGLHGKPFEMDELNYLYEKKSGKWNIHFYILGRSKRSFSFTDFTFWCIHHSTLDAISIWLAFSASTSLCFSLKTFSSLHFPSLSRSLAHAHGERQRMPNIPNTHSHCERIKIFTEIQKQQISKPSKLVTRVTTSNMFIL